MLRNKQKKAAAEAAAKEDSENGMYYIARLTRVKVVHISSHLFVFTNFPSQFVFESAL